MDSARRGRARAGPAARLLARCAVLAAVAAVVVLLLALEGGALIVGAGLLGLILCAAGIWWFVAHEGVVRLFGALVAVAAPVGVLVLFAFDGLWITALVSSLCWIAALACGRTALRTSRPRRERHPAPAPRPEHPVLIMNPKSGGGKVGRFDLAERAEKLGARVILLGGSHRGDVADLARRAVDEGADLLGVAGGDGTQAQVAAVAAEHGLPFLVISAGTRNHFAMDLGLDRSDPARCLDALTDGEEVRVDLGDVSGRPFVNTVSFGVYADIVQSPEYRDNKTATALSLMPGLLARKDVEQLDARAGDTPLPGRQALLVSNNPYASPDDLGAAGRRPRLDTGELGVVGIRVENAAQAAELAVLGAQASGLTVTTARRVEVTADESEISVAVDGEALRMRTPVVCTVRPGALRVVVPRDRPGVPPATPPMDWRRVLALAFGRSEKTTPGETRA